MKFSTSLTTALLALSTSISYVCAIRSLPFYLLAISDDDKINGTAFNACHEGAAIEGLCKGVAISKSDAKYTTYNFNYTKNEPNSGPLTYELIGGNFKDSEPMLLNFDAGSNVALPLFFPGPPYTYVGFDTDELMFIRTFVDDTVTPPKSVYPGKKLYRWYMCETNNLAYVYQTLAWVLGKYPPQNPSCKKIQVKRVFKKDV